MSGMPALKAIEKKCCALRYGVRKWRALRGKAEDTPHFTCEACGQAYHLDAGGWQPVSPLDDLKQMVAEDRRGHLYVDGVAIGTWSEPQGGGKR